MSSRLSVGEIEVYPAVHDTDNEHQHGGRGPLHAHHGPQDHRVPVPRQHTATRHGGGERPTTGLCQHV